MSTQTQTPSVLIVGATGQQGGAVIEALLRLPHPRPKILALTRDVSSPRARALAESHPDDIELVQGDSTSPDAIFQSRPQGSITGLFIVTVPPKGAEGEEAQAIPLIDAAVSHGVRHIVFSSVDRGGDERSWENPTGIKHFYQKHNVEVYLRDKAAAAAATAGAGGEDKAPPPFTWTILRPVAFLDNMNPGIFCSLFTSMWSSALSPATKLQLVSVHDIGVFAAKALSSPERWAGRAVGLAGDELTLSEAQERFRKTIPGKELPQAWGVVGGAMLWVVGDMGDMFAFFEKEGYGVDIGELKREEPGLQDFETWLRESSAWTER